LIVEDLRMGTTSSLVIVGFAVALAGAGCSKIVGFKDVTLEEQGDGGPTDARPDADDGSVEDAMPDAMVDAMIDGPPPPDQLWIFHTSAGFAGNFGSPNGARTTADIKCQDIYNLAFTGRNCSLTNIHAIIQVDDTVDSIARMEITFPIPQGVEIKRAAADATTVASDWDELINPNSALLAPVSPSGTVITFWSGRGASSNMTCGGWQSTAGNGNAGDVTKVNAWTNQSAPLCSSANQKLLCICW
jgi:hypothetical protein